MVIKLYNALTKDIQEFTPQNKDGYVLLYTCGPTIYNTPHIGNYRAYVFADVLKRTILLHGMKVKHTTNLTDVDDKIVKKVNELHTDILNFTKPFENMFYSGLASLDILPSNFYPRATDYIPEMQKIIRNLLNKDFAYIANDKSIYFNVSKDKKYGQLVHIDKSELKQNALGRMNNADEYERDSVQDFALWKAYDVNDGNIKWNSYWGEGRPGWHIECSAMACKTLGKTIDIHTGGIDNMFPHHENEIAQSECCFDTKFSNFFLHCGHLQINGKKMAKRDGNFITLNDLMKNGIHPLSYKYFLYTVHYQISANLTTESLQSAQTSLRRIYEKVILLYKKNKMVFADINTKPNEEYIHKLKESLGNNLNTAEALALLITLVDDIISMSEYEKMSTILSYDYALGLGITQYIKEYLTTNKNNGVIKIDKLYQERLKARQEKDYNKSDILRDQIQKMGFIIVDTKDDSIIVHNPLYTNN
jgi:cysteinyl-tRNA synthetase